jgi:hypothetical protein
MRDKDQKNSTLNRFIRKNLLYYLIPNVFFNTCIPYLTLNKLESVYLFQGEYCFARFLLPMVFFLPFIITFDISKKTVELYQQGRTDFAIPEPFQKKKHFFKTAGVNSGLTFFFALFLLLTVEFFIPKNYTFNGTLLSILLGVLAGLLTVIFTLFPIAKLKRLSLS